MKITFLAPWWLLLLAVLPLVVWQSVGSLSGLGPIRKWLAIGLRMGVLLLLIAALADLEFVHESDRFCTLFVLDDSQSIPAERSAAALKFISQAINRRQRDRDQAGLIVFGKNARIEVPPAEYPRDRDIRSIGSLIDRQYSNLAAGLKLAFGSFPPDSAKRIVLISDGNQNQGNALTQAIVAQQSSVPIDVLPIDYYYDSEVLVDKLVLPPELRTGDTAKLKIVLRSSQPASGLLRLNRLTDAAVETVLEEPIELEAGLTVKSVDLLIDDPDFYTYEAQFEPGPNVRDRVARNNQASAFTWIRGVGRVLLISQNRGDHEQLASKLRSDEIAVDVRQPDQVRKMTIQLKQYDSILIANVPAEQLGEELQESIAANTRELGAGLIMIGGEDSFGAGGYIGSPLEKALPVEMQIKSTKIRSKGALVLIMHACEIPEGNFWQKKIAKLAIDMLGSQDECGLIYWGGKTSWLFPLQPVGLNRARMHRRIDTMTPGDMPDFDSAMRKSLDFQEGLTGSSAMTKHVIIVSDGDASPPTAPVLQKYVDSKITCTTVAVASHGPAESALMKRIARKTGGRYYQVNNPRTLPQIYIKETRVVARPLIFEKPNPWTPTIFYPAETVAGMPAQLPAIKGFVLTTPKPTAEVVIVSPVPAENDINPILAHWQYGLGRAVAFTTDAGQKWAIDWLESELYAKFWSQLVRWTLRPSESKNLSVSTQEKDGMVTVVVNAMDEQSEYLDFLRIDGKLVRPDSVSADLNFRQTAPGKYVARFDAEQSGAYFLQMGYRQPDDSRDFICAGINVPYPPEYRDTQSNPDLLANIATLSEGQVLNWNEVDQVDFFRRHGSPSFELQDVWPILLLISLCTFLADVAVRRISIDPHQVALRARRIWARLRSREVAEVTVTMERLRSKKVEVEEQLGRRRFQADIQAPSVTGPVVSGEPSEKPEKIEKTAQPEVPKPETLAPKPEESQEPSFTSRLLKAKKKIWEDRNRKS